MPPDPYDLEKQINSILERVGRTELELQNDIRPSLEKILKMYKDQSDYLDQMTGLLARLVAKVFPEQTPADFLKSKKNMS